MCSILLDLINKRENTIVSRHDRGRSDFSFIRNKFDVSEIFFKLWQILKYKLASI